MAHCPELPSLKLLTGYVLIHQDNILKKCSCYLGIIKLIISIIRYHNDLGIIKLMPRQERTLLGMSVIVGAKAYSIDRILSAAGFRIFSRHLHPCASVYKTDLNTVLWYLFIIFLQV